MGLGEGPQAADVPHLGLMPLGHLMASLASSEETDADAGLGHGPPSHTDSQIFPIYVLIQPMLTKSPSQEVGTLTVISSNLLPNV